MPTKKFLLKKKTFTIKRENRKHKFITVVRLKGRIVAQRAWNQKNNLVASKQQFSKNETFKKDTIQHHLTNVIEINDFTRAKKPPKPRITKYQYLVTSTIKGRTSVSAVSGSHDLDFPREKARKEALNNFFQRFFEEIEGSYPEFSSQGEAVFKEFRINNRATGIREAIRYYAPI